MLFLVFSLFSLISVSLAADSCDGVCSKPQHCNHVDDWNKDKKEVIIVATEGKDYDKWMWDSFTTVIEWSDTFNKQLMCRAHSKGKKYGIYLKDFPNTLDASSHEVLSFINSTRENIELQHADVFALNLIDYLGNCSYAGEHVTGIYNVTSAVIKGIKAGTKTKVLCVMPWKPPCYDSECMINPALAQICDGLILSPDSYNTYCDESCTAKATVSYAKIVIGLTEYLAAGWTSTQIIAGIPWHGYNYTCRPEDHVDNITAHFVCHLKVNDNNGTKECDLEGSRRRMSVGAMVGEIPEMALMDATYSKADQAPWKVDTIINGSVKQNYLTWFEDIGSLMSKYELVSHYNLKGIIIFSADDLTYTKIPVKADDDFNEHMWAWLLHSVLAAGDVSHEAPKHNMAGTVAGVGVGLFIFGCVFGTLVSCIIFRKKRTLQPPFSRDPVPTDEYTDDEEHHRTSRHGKNMYSDHNQL